MELLYQFIIGILLQYSTTLSNPYDVYNIDGGSWEGQYDDNDQQHIVVKPYYTAPERRKLLDAIKSNKKGGALDAIEKINEVDKKEKNFFYEGDMELKNEDIQQGTIQSENNALWKKGTDGLVHVPLMLNNGILRLDKPSLKNLGGVIELFKQRTCIRFDEIESSALKKTKPAADEVTPVTVSRGVGCHATVGYQVFGGDISLGNNCDDPDVIAHMLMHTLGFFHEHTRIDRDDSINVNFPNIRIGLDKYFKTYQKGRILAFPYDKRSIMHFGKTTFATPGMESLSSKADPREELGGTTMSESDFERVNKIYDCK